MGKTGLPIRRTMNFDRFYKVAYNRFDKDTFAVTLYAGDDSGKTNTIILSRKTGYDFILPKISPIPLEKGYVFIGWSYTPDGDLIQEDKITISENTKLFGKCDIILTLDSNNESKDTISYQMAKNTYFGLPKQMFDAPISKTFCGWGYAKDGGNIEEEKILIKKPTVLYSHWQANTTI